MRTTIWNCLNDHSDCPCICVSKISSFDCYRLHLNGLHLHVTPLAFCMLLWKGKAVCYWLRFLQIIFRCLMYSAACICRKIWGSGSVRSSHQTVSDYTLRQWFLNTQQSRFLTACRRLEKLVFTFYCWHKSFILDVKFAGLSNNSLEWKNDTSLYRPPRNIDFSVT